MAPVLRDHCHIGLRADLNGLRGTVDGWDEGQQGWKAFVGRGCCGPFAWGFGAYGSGAHRGAPGGGWEARCRARGSQRKPPNERSGLSQGARAVESRRKLQRAARLGLGTFGYLEKSCMGAVRLGLGDSGYLEESCMGAVYGGSLSRGGMPWNSELTRAPWGKLQIVEESNVPRNLFSLSQSTVAPPLLVQGGGALIPINTISYSVCHSSLSPRLSGSWPRISLVISDAQSTRCFGEVKMDNDSGKLSDSQAWLPNHCRAGSPRGVQSFLRGWEGLGRGLWAPLGGF